MRIGLLFPFLYSASPYSSTLREQMFVKHDEHIYPRTIHSTSLLLLINASNFQIDISKNIENRKDRE